MKRVITGKLFLLFWLLAGFVNLYAQPIKDYKEFVKYLDAKEKKYEEISVNFGMQTWNLYSLENKADLKSAKEMYMNLYNDAELRDNINGWDSRLKQADDVLVKRRVAIWKNILNSASVEYDPEIIKLSASLLEDVRNRDPKNSEASVKLEKRIFELIKLRNEKVKKAGFNNYAEFVFESTGLGYKWFTDFVDRVDKATAPVYKELFEKIKAEKGSVSFRDLGGMEQDLPEPVFSSDSLYLLMKETLADIGIDYNKLPIRFVVKDADFGGNCIGVSIPEDLRVIMVPNMPISVYLHELGHGLQWMKTSINNPILEGYEWCLGSSSPGFYEGMAQMLAGFCKQPEWYKKYAGYSNEKVESVLKHNKFAEAVNIRRTLVGFLIEVELYKNPAKSPSEVCSELIKKYLWIDNVKVPYSIVNTLYIDYPCYLHNYFLADIIAWQVHDAMRNKFGNDYMFKKETGDYLINSFYKDGTLKDWKQIMKDATGKELDAEGYLKHLGL